MRRTLLAVGIAVLASMTFARHSSFWGWDLWGSEWGSYNWDYFPVFAKADEVLWRAFFAQTAFAGVLAAVLVNLRRSKRALPEGKGMTKGLGLGNPSPPPLQLHKRPPTPVVVAPPPSNSPPPLGAKPIVSGPATNKSPTPTPTPTGTTIFAKPNPTPTPKLTPKSHRDQHHHG
jgi:hypothetical protein